MKQYKYWSDGYDSGLMPFPKKEYEDKKVIFVEDLRKLLKEKREYKKKLIADLPEDYEDWLYDYHELCGQVTALTEMLDELEMGVSPPITPKKEDSKKRSFLAKEEVKK